ncbi:MAG: hypothetical protein UX70_C0001G0650 [Candidatus Wolfebacteria bacterium GW2011_GWB1_47_1]|uniref:Uncharacterized protein n=1 Tax=Candidatus Wolfebacteria bacterium GW2011_GWB1_47_1 TaxID=1619007 RepID=A0A0G4ARL5_9BACT|nr:MAG: hypothetical protein UX70_C0001G0650 [Candidatus Wolfebacteria bacterium GW2011_GWB1_47_1]
MFCWKYNIPSFDDGILVLGIKKPGLELGFVF